MHRADSGDGSVHIYAKLAQAYARTAYACFDQPDLKAVFTFQVTAPARWAVLSNQPQDHAGRLSADLRTVRFLPTPPVPTFTTTVVAGDYHVVTTEHATPDGQQVPLELACRASLARYIDADAVFALTRQGLDFYTGWLGTVPIMQETTGPETVTAVADGLMQPEHADLLIPYASRFLAEIPDLWRTRSGHMRVLLANVLFPYPAVTPEFLPRLDGFLAAEGGDGGLSRIVRDHRDTAERVLRARALDLSPRRG
jgi:hypothetical protein